MADKRPALGRGLSALIPPASPPASPPPPAPAAARDPHRAHELDLDLLTPNPHQPRTELHEPALDELAQSIRANGVLQPILVRPAGYPYQSVAAPRRWRGAQRAGLLKVPVIVREVPDDKLLQVALIENIQREDLNAIEAANAYRRLHEDMGLSQDAIATAVGKDRATVANYLRLLRLPIEVRQQLSSGALDMGHARAILALADEASQRRVAREVIRLGLSVRETEALVRREGAPRAAPAAKRADPNTRAAEERLRLALGTRVRIIRRGNGGRIEVDFGSEGELQRLFEKLTG
jgi:ParB family chromosome partitioning protein